VKAARIATWVVILLAFVAGAVIYPRLPEMVASHWNALGQVDGFMPRLWGVFLVPLMMVGMGLLFMVIPAIDPLKQNIAAFRPQYDRFIVLIMIFMLAIHAFTLLWNVGVQLSMNRFMPVAIGLVFFFVGDLMRNAKRNFFVGIRTPWTLSNDVVWAKTHRLGALLFQIAGVLVALGALIDRLAIWFILVPAIAAGLIPTIYSYFEFRRLERVAPRSG
jgi:immunity protein, SdpI family